MSTCRLDFDHRDLVRMYKTLDAAGKAPQKALNKGTSKAAQITKRAVKGVVPYRSGRLKANIVTKTERSSKKGKKVRETTIRGGAEANAIFQKPILHPGTLGGQNAKAYYPASMEYGFLARARGGGTIFVDFNKKLLGGYSMAYANTTASVPTQKVEGRHYMRSGAESASEPAKKAMIETIEKELDKAWQS